jgi:hypothetical protein
VSHTNFARYVTLYLRLALAAAYLSSVADRFGLWGAGVGWGNFANFLDYTAKLNPFLPLMTRSNPQPPVEFFALRVENGALLRSDG